MHHNTNPVQPSLASTITDPGEVQAASVSASTTRGVELTSDISSSDPNKTVTAPPNDPADWPPVLTDIIRTELVRSGPFKPGFNFSYPKTSLEEGSIQAYYRVSCQIGQRFRWDTDTDWACKEVFIDNFEQMAGKWKFNIAEEWR